MSKYIIIFLFTFSWTKLFSQTVSVSVSATLTRVLYQWIDNPLKVVVENNSCKSLIVKADKGQIKGSNCEYIYIASSDKIKQDIIKVGLKQNGKVRWISETIYRVIKLPDPIAYFANSLDGDTVPKNLIKAQFAISLPRFDFGICSFDNERLQVIKSYRVTITRGNKIIFSESVNSNLLTEKFKKFVGESCITGDNIMFDNLKALLYEKENRDLVQTIRLVVST